MALQGFSNKFGQLFFPAEELEDPALTARTMDAAGESHFGIGRLLLSTGIGTSKVFSSAGAKIYWSLASATFANGSTNLRLGIQDVSAAVEDGTFDVYADLVGGTDTLTPGVMATAFETGTKTIAHGDVVAVGMEMTARGGADTVVARSYPSATHLNTYLTNDTGSGPTRGAGLPLLTVTSDDGTVGWIIGTRPTYDPATVSFGNGSTPDEYATIFRVPFAAKCIGIAAYLDTIISTDTYDLVLYSDPLGVTPVAERTLTIDPTLVVGTTSEGLIKRIFTSEFTLEINTDYAVAVLPTSAGTIELSRLLFGTGNGVLRTQTLLGTSWSEGTRSDVTGAFTSNTEALSFIGPILSAFDDAAGGAGSMMRPVGMRGGLI